MWIIVLLGALALALPAAAGTPNPKIILKTDQLSEEQVSQAIVVFSEVCKPLMEKYTADIIAIEAEAFSEFAPYRMVKGWKATISLAIKLKARASVIPADYRADGHTLWYDLGGGAEPGFFAAKEVSQRLCGLKPERGRDVFKAVPAMSVLAPIELKRGSVFETLSSGPFGMIWQPQKTLEDGRLFTEGYSQTGMQSLGFLGPTGQSPEVRADIDWRPENQRTGKAFLHTVLQLTLPEGNAVRAQDTVAGALPSMPVGGEIKKRFGDHVMILRRRSEVMFTMIVQGQNISVAMSVAAVVYREVIGWRFPAQQAPQTVAPPNFIPPHPRPSPQIPPSQP